MLEEISLERDVGGLNRCVRRDTIGRGGKEWDVNEGKGT